MSANSKPTCNITGFCGHLPPSWPPLSHSVVVVYVNLKTFKDSFYSSQKHFLFDNCGFLVYEIKVFLRNLAIVSNGN